MSWFNPRAQRHTEDVAVTAPTTESDEFQIPGWAAKIGAFIPATAGKGSIELHVSQTTGGTFIPVVEVQGLKKAGADGGYFELTDHIAGLTQDWFFKFVFGNSQTTTFDITMSYRGA